jgi:hypothetical protein
VKGDRIPDTDFVLRRCQPSAHPLCGAGALKMSLLPFVGITSPTPSTLFPLLKAGEGRGEGGAYTHVPCPLGALLVTLYHPKSKAFLMCGGGGHACLRGERQPHLTLPSYIQKPFARNWYKKTVLGYVGVRWRLCPPFTSQRSPPETTLPFLGKE